MSDKLDPVWIMAQLREMLIGYEQSLRSDHWHVLLRVTYRPSGGSTKEGITFVVGTEPADQDDE